MKKALVITEKDNIATLLDHVEAGDTVILYDKNNNKTGEVQALEAVRFGHKIAIAAIAEGADVIKYNEIIGRAFKTIPEGAHTHVHNFGSYRESMAAQTSVEGRRT